MPDVIRLADLPPDPDAAEGDPGTDWHPRPDKAGVRDEHGNLRDLDDDEIAQHFAKPEAANQPDGVRSLELEEPRAAEDSHHSPAGEV